MKCTTLLIAILLAISFSSFAAKSEKNARIVSAAQLQNWCKKLSYRYFRHKKQQPYNWSASTIRNFNTYQTTGSWRVNNVEKHIYCEIQVGKKAKKTKIEIR